MWEDAAKWVIDFGANVGKSVSAFANLSSQAIGSVTAVSAAWGEVTYIGPMISALIGAIIRIYPLQNR